MTDSLRNADCVNNNNNNIERTASLAKRIKTNKNRKKSTHCQGFNGSSSLKDNIEKLIYISKVKNNRNNLNIMVTNSTGREFSRVDIKSLTRLYLLIDRAKANVANVFNIVISKLDKVPTQELSSYIKTELLRNNSRKFYRLVITSKDTHYKQIIKKAYIMLLERALLILFIT
ncbi:hypothetical protein HBI62_041110 [Parastagonospora nodorum]|nr:hypothetical protein HBI62_041110 [Parastagonospora nodorum]KAH6144763.1 hypothetical protein HBI63_175910 [Parastagonospora nodorum]KAH6174022.1 hypothetical protein HBI61_156610 [Parastagonospora nodorum]